MSIEGGSPRPEEADLGSNELEPDKLEQEKVTIERLHAVKEILHEAGGLVLTQYQEGLDDYSKFHFMKFRNAGNQEIDCYIRPEGHLIWTDLTGNSSYASELLHLVVEGLQLDPDNVGIYDGDGSRVSWEDYGQPIQPNPSRPPTQYLKNADGQLVDPRNNEPIQRYSDAHKDIQRHNILPRNQFENKT